MSWNHLVYSQADFNLNPKTVDPHQKKHILEALCTS